ncbi:hypothetical protein IFM89_031704 [Coptis chinensis]|uniref:malate dehydrogenase n=1 Tax=Coptis chinensis TaxID=261450 RepID=A0A835LTI8_9MAGN|nr:hypothetical protein IFM89_031704 [Coptis chinensis]
MSRLAYLMESYESKDRQTSPVLVYFELQKGNSLKSFSGLKAESSVRCESETSFFGKESSATLQASFAPSAEKQAQNFENRLQPQASTFKVAILGAAGGIGQPLANIVKILVEAVLDNCPDVFIHIISNPVNSTIPIAAEILKQKGVYNPKKLFGVTTPDVVRANTFVAHKKNLRLIDVDVPVVGGHAGITILPLLTLQVYECSFVQSDLTELPFFAYKIKLSKNGVEVVISLDVQGLTEYETNALEAFKLELQSSIEKGVAFARKSKRPGKDRKSQIIN